MVAQLVVIRGDLHSDLVPLRDGDVLLVGRGSRSTLHLADPYVSRRHAEVRMEAGIVSVRDLGSRNGTHLNGRRLDPEAPAQVLWSGDVVRLGATQLRIRPGTIESAGEWERCQDPDLMLRTLRGRASPRKLRLFACACFRGVWDLLPDRPSRDLVVLGERYADGQISVEELQDATTLVGEWSEHGTATAWPLSLLDPLEAATRAAHRAWLLAEIAGVPGVENLGTSWQRETHPGQAARRLQCEMLRDLFCPFSCPRLDPTWTQINAACVTRVARAIYDEGTFQDLPVLADALEEAGCDDQVLLTHLRTPSPHVRGCWALDAVLALS